MSVKRDLTKDELIRTLSERTGFYICNCKTFIDAYEEIILDNLKTAIPDENSKMYICHGITLLGEYIPETTAKDPRTGEECVSQEHVRPNIKFTQHFRNKLFPNPHGYEQRRCVSDRRRKKDFI